MTVWTKLHADPHTHQCAQSSNQLTGLDFSILRQYYQVKHAYYVSSYERLNEITVLLCRQMYAWMHIVGAIIILVLTFSPPKVPKTESVKQSWRPSSRDYTASSCLGTSSRDYTTSSCLGTYCCLRAFHFIDITLNSMLFLIGFSVNLFRQFYQECCYIIILILFVWDSFIEF